MRTSTITLAIAATVGFAALAHGQEKDAPKQTLFRNVNIFDGTSETLVPSKA